MKLEYSLQLFAGKQIDKDMAEGPKKIDIEGNQHRQQLSQAKFISLRKDYSDNVKIHA